MAESVLIAAKKNQMVPTEVIYYRDGVSEGQFRQVKDLEVPQLRSAIQKVWPTEAGGKPPGISCIIAKKRHHTRFFNADNDSNVGAGRKAAPHSC
jgi:eukaryotic translation initiation factor 2C